MPELAVGQHDAGEKRAQRHRQACHRHQHRRAEHDEQRGGGEHLGRAGAGRESQQRTQEEASDDQQQREHTDQPCDGDPRAAFSRDVGARRLSGRCAAEQRQYGEHRQDGQVLEQQHAEGRAPMFSLELAALGQRLQHQRRRGEGETEADDDRRLQRLPDPHRNRAQHQCHDNHLRGAEPKHDFAQRPQPRRLQFEADHEQQQDDPELREMRDRLDVADQSEREGADQHAGGEIGQHRS